MDVMFGRVKFLYYPILFFFSFNIAFGQVIFTEIMYDVAGSDMSREWVEISNSGDNVVDIAGWRFFEGGTNHKLSSLSGAYELKPKESAVIVDNPVKFLEDWPAFSGTIFESSFSLKNIGEQIILRDSELSDIDSVSYSSDWGASDDGNSLQRINGVWTNKHPTPGKYVFDEDSTTDAIKINATNQASTQNTKVEIKNDTISTANSWPTDQNIFTRIKPMNKVVVSGSSVRFIGETLGLKKEIVNNDARYLWSFGDGGSKEGKEVLHSYSHSGQYVVVLDTSLGAHFASDRIYIEVIPADIIISSVGVGTPEESFIEIKNNTKYELDLSGWIIRSGISFFTIPKNTIIMKNSSIIFSGENTGFDTKYGEIVELLYQNNRKLFSYDWNSGNGENSDVDLVTSTSAGASAGTAQTMIQTITKKDEVSVKKETVIEKQLPVAVINDENAKEKQVTSSESNNENQLANVSNTLQKDALGSYKYFFGVLGLATLSVLTFLSMGKEDHNTLMIEVGQNDGVDTFLTKETDGWVNADEYEIIEDKLINQ